MVPPVLWGLAVFIVIAVAVFLIRRNGLPGHSADRGSDRLSRWVKMHVHSPSADAVAQEKKQLDENELQSLYGQGLQLLATTGEEREVRALLARIRDRRWLPVGLMAKLSGEIALLMIYLDMERYCDKQIGECIVTVDDAVDVTTMNIPSCLLQGIAEMLLEYRRWHCSAALAQLSVSIQKVNEKIWSVRMTLDCDAGENAVKKEMNWEAWAQLLNTYTTLRIRMQWLNWVFKTDAFDLIMPDVFSRGGDEAKEVTVQVNLQA
ncbi:hypothetical protein JMG10_02815 [Nostoc ellipsosporum NOK]|nr:hypothetical protein [Nostoc ellipsosporum NOK]